MNVLSDSVIDSDPTEWDFLAKGYNSCNTGRFVYQYFKIIFEPRPPDCSNV